MSIDLSTARPFESTKIGLVLPTYTTPRQLTLDRTFRILIETGFVASVLEVRLYIKSSAGIATYAYSICFSNSSEYIFGTTH